jgi:hypothetical protein
MSRFLYAVPVIRQHLVHAVRIECLNVAVGGLWHREGSFTTPAQV